MTKLQIERCAGRWQSDNFPNLEPFKDSKISKWLCNQGSLDVPAESTKMDNCELICNSDLKHHSGPHLFPAEKRQEETNSFNANHFFVLWWIESDASRHVNAEAWAGPAVPDTQHSGWHHWERGQQQRLKWAVVRFHLSGQIPVQVWHLQDYIFHCAPRTLAETLWSHCHLAQYCSMKLSLITKAPEGWRTVTW